MISLLAFALTAFGEPTPTHQPTEPLALVGPGLIEPHLPMPAPLAEALAHRNHDTAIALLQAMDTQTLPGPDVGDHAFLLAWSLLRANRGEDAFDLLDKVGLSRTAPEAYQQLTIGEIHLAKGNAAEAAAALEAVPQDSVIAPRALLQAAEAYKSIGATKEALTIHQRLAERDDPADGSEIALWALAKKRGTSNPTSEPLLRRLWMHYPMTRQGQQASAALGSYHRKATDAERANRVDRLMQLQAWKAITSSLSNVLTRYELGTEVGCRARYAYGRSLFKRNQISLAAQILTPVGERCAEVDGDRGAKALYIAGKSLERKKAWAQAATVYERIPALYPDHTMADDGYALAGIAWQEAGDAAKARRRWERQVDAYPEGDLAGEGFWRLAWSDYQSGDTQAAIGWVERMATEVPITVDPVHVVGAKYWAARWRIYPDVENPQTPNADAEAVATGIDGLIQLCITHPGSFYALFAAARLHELAPERLATLPEIRPRTPSDTWSVRATFLNAPAIERALALARLRLTRESLAEFGTLETVLTPSEMSILTTFRGMSNPVRAHDKLHRYLLHHPPSTLGPDRDRILALAHPDLFWDTIQAQTADHDFDPRIFHALVREESSFNQRAQSWAGARGLSQLMPATAQQVAGQLGMRVSTSQLYNPEINLKIGAHYLNYLFGYFDDNPFLAVAAYNAGEGNVGKWLTRFGPVPSDEFVELIPFRETRGYVKRVLGTYQVYRTVYDPDPLFPDWQHTNHKVSGPRR